jgi:hypothetical protein
MGPVSKAHPAEAQPVAAGPTKVGAKLPRLDDVTPLGEEVVVFVADAAVAPTGATTSATTSDNRDSRDRSAILRRIMLSFEQLGSRPHPAQASTPDAQRGEGPRARPYRRTQANIAAGIADVEYSPEFDAES